MKILTKKMRLRKDFPFEEMIKMTPGYVGADIQTLCKEASIIAVERIINGTGKEVKAIDEKENEKGGEAEKQAEEHNTTANFAEGESVE